MEGQQYRHIYHNQKQEQHMIDEQMGMEPEYQIQEKNEGRKILNSSNIELQIKKK